MKLLNLSKTLSIGLITTVLSTMPMILPVVAQTQVNPDTTTPTTTTDRDNRDYDDGFDWGWLGLLGLIGLAGLKRKPEEQAYRRDMNADPSTTTRNDYR